MTFILEWQLPPRDGGIKERGTLYLRMILPVIH
jgi:hypothetical protein